MGSARALSGAFYKHLAFQPHRGLARLGIRSFALQNTVVTAASALALFFCAFADGAVFLGTKGYGFLEHPGIFGWFSIQLFMPLAIHGALKRSIRALHHFGKLALAGDIKARSELYDPLLAFIGFRTAYSRTYFSILFTIGFSAFAWNSYHNAFPGTLAPLDFWDSINFIGGYFSSRIYKFYMDALLLPSVIHIFSGIVWFNARFLRGLDRDGSIRIIPFGADGCGGVGFLSDLILSPAITAQAVSGLALFGVIYTHHRIEISLAVGLFIECAVFIAFYMIPTLLLREAIVKLKSREISELCRVQTQYYDAVVNDCIQGQSLRDMAERNEFCLSAINRITKIPKWPHLYKMFGALGLSVAPSIATLATGALGQWLKLLMASHV